MTNERKDIRFDKRAAKYDGFEGRVSRRFYSLLLAQISVKSGATVLDVGCGTGTMLRKMADTYGASGYGIDMEENMINEARQKCPEMDIRVSSCGDTPFADLTFDAITACMAYHHFADKKGFAREAARILKPSGCLYIADPRFPFIIRKALNGVLKLFRITGFFGTPEEILGNFRPFGFEMEKVEIDGYAQVVKLRLAPAASK